MQSPTQSLENTPFAAMRCKFNIPQSTKRATHKIIEVPQNSRNLTKPKKIETKISSKKEHQTTINTE
jgi:hypothetical protein